jgi:hypothetical protein
MLFFILLSSLTVMNMLVGVLVEVVGVVSAVEKEEMTLSYVKSMLMSMLEDSEVDADENCKISKPEFERLLLKPKAARILQEVGVDVVGLVDFLDFIFKDGTELSFPEFMDVVLQLRGTNNATVRDVVDLRKFVLNEIDTAIVTITTTVKEIVGKPDRSELEGNRPSQIEDTAPWRRPQMNPSPLTNDPIEDLVKFNANSLANTGHGKVSHLIERDSNSQQEMPTGSSLPAPMVNSLVDSNMMGSSATSWKSATSSMANYPRNQSASRASSASRTRTEPQSATPGSGTFAGPRNPPPARGRSSSPRRDGNGPGPPHVGSAQPLPQFPDHLWVTEFRESSQDRDVAHGSPGRSRRA